jgi:molybdopterin/thiamine biosynthesis adenylyltransferase/rhodanese-related sulfurtransferase
LDTDRKWGNISRMKTLKEMLADARQVIPEEGPADLQRRLAAGEPVTVIDVRDPDEFRDGHIEAASNISRGFLEFRIGAARDRSKTPIVLYCQTGLRSMLAAKALHELGYEKVINLQGGYQKWAQSGLPTVKETALTTDQIQRYSRHFLLNQVGDKGQRKLLRSKALLIGAGGLGSPTALYLAAAGVGHARADGRRRGRHHEPPAAGAPHHADVGKPKVESGTRTLKALNPDVNVDLAAHAHHGRQRDGRHQGLRSRHRRLGQLRDALPRQRRLLPGGQDERARLDLPVRGHGHGVRAERRALLPLPLSHAAAAGARPLLKRGGVLGVLPGVIGLVQATEAVKLLLGIGEPLIGRLLTYDALGMRFREVRLRRDPKCPLCGLEPDDQGSLDPSRGRRGLRRHAERPREAAAPAPGGARASVAKPVVTLWLDERRRTTCARPRSPGSPPPWSSSPSR